MHRGTTLASTDEAQEEIVAIEGDISRLKQEEKAMKDLINEMSVTLRQETEKEQDLMYVTQEDFKQLSCYEVCIAGGFHVRLQ